MTAPETLAALLGDRFTIERELGRGGMAVVYLAIDKRHRRRVALKILKPELAASIGAERFQREIRLAASLAHPNILPLLEAGDDRTDPPYFVAPYVEGDTLRARLAAGPVSVDDAVRIAIEVADALEYAHRRGIVHRDIKPENILLLEGHAVVTDFGIARAIDEAGGDGLTQTGVILGTPAYLSPEQLDGAATVDGRSDVFSLGSVVYEMLAGVAPFSGPTTTATLARLTAGTPTPLMTARSDVPEPLARIVGRALERDRDKRFASVGEFADALRGIHRTATIVGRPHVVSRVPFVVLGVAALAAALFATRTWIRGGSDEPPSIAILPFATDKGDTASAYLGSGIAEEILGALADVPGLRVRSRTSSFSLGPAADIREIGRRLAVKAVLEGSVARNGPRLHVVARLIDPRDDSQMWQQTFDLPNANVFDLQEQIARNVVRRLRVRLASDTITIIHRRSRSAEANDLVLRAKYLARGDQREGLLAAADLLSRAATLDSTYAEVPSAEAQVFERLAIFRDQSFVPGQAGMAAGETLRRARVAAGRAVELDPKSAAAHEALGSLAFRYDWDWPAAEREIRRAITLNPSSATARLTYSRFLRSMGRFDEARAALDTAAMNDPHSVAALAYGRISYFAGDFTRAMRETAADTDRSTRTWAQWYAEALMLGGRFAEAESLLVHTENNDVPAHLSALAIVAARSGQLARARSLLTAIGNESSGAATLYAGALIAVGDTTAALAQVERAVQLHDPLVVDLNVDPRLDALRGVPRFDAVVRRLRFPVHSGRL